jgi:hypothetical protein
LAILPGDPTISAEQAVTLTLPRELINPGGSTKLFFRSPTEGTPSARHLGGAFAARR